MKVLLFKLGDMTYYKFMVLVMDTASPFSATRARWAVPWSSFMEKSAPYWRGSCKVTLSENLDLMSAAQALLYKAVQFYLLPRVTW